MATGIADIQTVDWTVDFPDGLYTYHCDRHAEPDRQLRGAGGAPPAPPVTSPAARQRGACTESSR